MCRRHKHTRSYILNARACPNWCGRSTRSVHGEPAKMAVETVAYVGFGCASGTVVAVAALLLLEGPPNSRPRFLVHGIAACAGVMLHNLHPHFTLPVFCLARCKSSTRFAARPQLRRRHAFAPCRPATVAGRGHFVLARLPFTQRCGHFPISSAFGSTEPSFTTSYSIS